jgi:acylphosphatase
LTFMKTNKVRVHVFISGRVQGVFFRLETRNLATRRNVTGWVRNTSNGRVEAIFEGEKEDVEKLIEFCRKGPSGASVTKLDVQWEEYSKEFKDFKIRRRTIF